MGWSFYTSGGVEVTSAALGSEFPIGTIIDYGGGAAPTNWLLCDGSAVSRTTYNQLFDVIGTAYGAGNGSTTFNLPDSTGQIIYFKRGPAAFTYATTAPTFVTNLPSSPVDGQEIYYQADATNGVIWHLRYRTGSASSYKWEFIGGSALSGQVIGTASNSGGSTTYASMPTSAVSKAVPLAGEYAATWGAGAAWSTTAGSAAYLNISINNSAPVDNDAILFETPGGETSYIGNSSSLTRLITVGTAGHVVELKYRAQEASRTWNWRAYFLSIVPVRVG
jgi:microcystin-dependent protein